MKKWIYLVWILFVFTNCTAQKEAKEPITSFIKIKTDSFYNSKKIPGVSVAVYHNNKTIFYTAGLANKKTKALFTLQTIFEIGSITKTFTAYIVKKVLMDHNIPDTSRILEFLPDSLQANPALAEIRFVDLLNHSAGFSKIPANLKITEAPYDDYTLPMLYRYLKSYTPKPKGKYDYSNTGMALAGVLAAGIVKKTYAEMVDAYIYSPFKMGKKTERKQFPLSQGYMEESAVNFWKMDVFAPTGSLQFSTLELINYLKFICIKNNKSKQQNLILGDLLQPMLKINKNTSIGKGWHILTNVKNPVYWHNGGTFGFSTFCAFNRENQTAVVVCVNKFNENNVSDILGVTIMKKLME